MPLQDQIIPILFTGGVETKTDSKSVSLGKLLTLENGEFEKPGKIIKRTGFDSLGVIGSSLGIAANIKNSTLLGIGANSVFSYSASTLTFLNSGTLYNLNAKVRDEVDNYYLRGSFDADMVVVGGYEIYSYASGFSTFSGTTAKRGEQITIKDKVTKNVTYESTVSNESTSGKLAANSTHAFFLRTAYFTPYADIVLSKIDPTQSNPIVASITIARTFASTGAYMYDMLVTASHLYLAYYSNNAGTNLKIDQYDFNLNLLNTTSITTTSSNDGVVSLAFDGTNLFVLYAINRTGFIDNVYNVYTASLGAVAGPISVFASNPWGGPTIYGGTMAISSLATSADNVLAIYSLYPPSTVSAYSMYCLLVKVKLTASGVTYVKNFINSGSLYSKMCQAFGKTWVVAAVNPDVSINTYADGAYYLYEVTESGDRDANTNGAAAKVLAGNAYFPKLELAPARPRPSLMLSGSSMYAALQVISSYGIKSGNETIAVYSGEFSQQSATFSGTSSIPDENYLFTNSAPAIFDTKVSEQGFNTAPTFQVYDIQTGYAVLQPGSYQYFAVWEWLDDNGQIHQSAPSAAITVNIVSPNSRVRLVVTNPFLTTRKQGNLALVFYRTTINGVTPYRLVGGAFPYIINNQVDRTETNAIPIIIDNLDDASIASNQILYTTGGILPNDPAPNFKFQWPFKERVMLGGLDDGNTIWYSKSRVAGEPIKFSALLYTNVNIAGGDVTAGGTLDDKCIFFKKNKIFYMYGDGPNDAGGGSAFSVPQEISSPVGCAYPKSVVAMPHGLMFKSEKGIYLLDRGLNSKYIGAPVEAYNSANITSAIHMAERNQVRFTLDTGICLMYDYLVDQWGVFTNLAAVGSALYQNKHTYIKSDGTILQQGSSYLDAGSTPITLTIGTPWIKFMTLQGFQRAKRLMLIGEYKSPHTLTVSLGFDYENSYTESHSWVPASVLGIDGEGTLDQFRVFPTRQKCEAMRVLISDNGTATTGEGYTLSELAVLGGMKKGLNKVSSARSI